MVEFGQKWLYSGKVIVLGQSGCIRAKWLYLGKGGLSGHIARRWSKLVVFGQNWLYSGKLFIFG